MTEQRPGHCVAVHTRCVLDRLKRCEQRVSAETERAEAVIKAARKMCEEYNEPDEWIAASDLRQAVIAYDKIRVPDERHAPDPAYELCARWHDEQYQQIRDNPLGPEGSLTAMQGAHMAAHRESAEHHRAGERPAPCSCGTPTPGETTFICPQHGWWGSEDSTGNIHWRQERPGPEGPHPWREATRCAFDKWIERKITARQQEDSLRGIGVEQPTQETDRPVRGTKLWLWRNGDHFLAYAHEYPTYGGGDPMVLGEPVAWAIFKTSSPPATGPHATVSSALASTGEQPDLRRQFEAIRAALAAVASEHQAEIASNIAARDHARAGREHYHAKWRNAEAEIEALRHDIERYQAIASFEAEGHSEALAKLARLREPEMREAVARAMLSPRAANEEGPTMLSEALQLYDAALAVITEKLT